MRRQAQCQTSVYPVNVEGEKWRQTALSRSTRCHFNLCHRKTSSCLALSLSLSFVLPLVRSSCALVLSAPLLPLYRLYTGYLSRSREKTVETSYDYYENANPVSKCQQGGRRAPGRAYMAYSHAHRQPDGGQPSGFC